ncbi:MAG: hypothetical protein RL748_3761, partial [Pseudomonadota bacterium]
MASNGDHMRNALKRFLLPEIADFGFVGKPVAFHRVRDNYHDLLSIQYWKYGGKFILEFARRERGPFVTSWGPVIPEEKLEIGYIDVLQRARLEQCGPRAGKGFRGFNICLLAWHLFCILTATFNPRHFPTLSMPSTSSRHRPATQQLHRLQFTGTGAEYFRIWVVNLLLTILTFGVYSAWAKVRRLQYFYRNTQLAGAIFDYHGNPKAILKGRILALVLIAAYKISSGISLAATVVVVVILTAITPWLLARAFRFKMVNSSYRGLRFNFNGSV